GVSNEKYCVAPAACIPSAVIHCCDTVLVAATSALCRACAIGNRLFCSAPTLPSHSSIACPFGNGCPFGSVVTIDPLMSPRSLAPADQVARFASANGPVLNHE